MQERFGGGIHLSMCPSSHKHQGTQRFGSSRCLGERRKRELHDYIRGARVNLPHAIEAFCVCFAPRRVVWIPFSGLGIVPGEFAERVGNLNIELIFSTDISCVLLAAGCSRHGQILDSDSSALRNGPVKNVVFRDNNASANERASVGLLARKLEVDIRSTTGTTPANTHT